MKYKVKKWFWSIYLRTIQIFCNIYWIFESTDEYIFVFIFDSRLTNQSSIFVEHCFDSQMLFLYSLSGLKSEFVVCINLFSLFSKCPRRLYTILYMLVLILRIMVISYKSCLGETNWYNFIQYFNWNTRHILANCMAIVVVTCLMMTNKDCKGLHTYNMLNDIHERNYKLCLSFVSDLPG